MSRRETIEAARVQDNFLAGLQAWVDLAALEERGSRVAAMEKMRDAKLNRSANLSLYGLRLLSIPEQIGDLTALTSLNLGCNRLTTLPEQIENLTALTSLNLSDNRLTTLPHSLINPPAGLHINLAFNPISPAAVATPIGGAKVGGGSLERDL